MAGIPGLCSVLEGLLVVANEQGDNIVEFEIDPETGNLNAANTIAAASPSSVVFLMIRRTPLSLSFRSSTRTTISAGIAPADDS